jgi:DNA-binding protein H-NS
MRQSDLDLEKLPIEKLLVIREHLNQVLKKKAEAERRELELRMEKLKDLTGGQDSGAMGPRNGSRYYPPVKPRYQNTAAPYELWSGRGLKPRWLAAALKSGKKLADFEIASEGTLKRRKA